MLQFIWPAIMRKMRAVLCIGDATPFLYSLGVVYSTVQYSDVKEDFWETFSSSVLP